MTDIQIRSALAAAERKHADDDARVLFEEDAPGYMRWETLDESIKAEYRRLAEAAKPHSAQ